MLAVVCCKVRAFDVSLFQSLSDFSYHQDQRLRHRHAEGSVLGEAGLVGHLIEMLATPDVAVSYETVQS
jgi:hypothetical protein